MEDLKFETSLGNLVRPCFKNKGLGMDEALGSTPSTAKNPPTHQPTNQRKKKSNQ